MQIDSEFLCNSVVLISSPRPDEEGTPRRIAEDLSTLSDCNGDFSFKHYDVKNKDSLSLVLRSLEKECAQGLRPILHLDMHGDQDKGLELGRSRENISWEELVDLLRPINIQTKNNLVLIITACHGLYVIKPITIHQPTPLFGLIAPQGRIKFKDVDDAVGPFYRELMNSGSLDQAYNKLSKIFRYFHSEKMLIISLAKYIKNSCKGRGAADRREDLLTEALQGGVPNTKKNRKAVRKKIKAGIQPDQKLLDRYSGIFLHGKRCSITVADIQRELKN